ncbi:hypothetical protein E0504_26565 [Parafrankia sp. BMG5.11]|nr:hypothetical protein E0504_26565 [Parafrankia sp. BMG5.11]
MAEALAVMGRPGFMLGLGPSHESLVRGAYGMSCDCAAVRRTGHALRGAPVRRPVRSAGPAAGRRC